MRLIDADAAFERFKKIYCSNCNNHNEIRCRACQLLDGADVFDDSPIIDPVRHGHWEAEYYTAFGTKALSKDIQLKSVVPKCSLCDKAFFFETLYCPNCGAKMDEQKVEITDEDFNDYSDYR